MAIEYRASEVTLYHRNWSQYFVDESLAVSNSVFRDHDELASKMIGGM